MTLAGTTWRLEADPVPDSPTPTLAFGSEGRFQAHTGVNRLTGTYDEDGAALVLRPGPMTLMAGPPEAMAHEQRLVAALAATARFRLDGDRLDLLDRAGAVLLAFGAGLRALPGTAWQARGVNDGRAAVVSSEATERLTLAFGTDETARGSTGVNQFTAPYQVEGPLVTFGPVATTRRAGPPQAMALEQQLLAALARVARWEADGEHLVLRDADGATQLVLAPHDQGQVGAEP